MEKRVTAFVRRHAFPLTIAVIATSFLLFFFLIPVLKVFSASLFDPAGKALTLTNYTHVLSSRFFLGALTNSLTIAALASVFTILIGVPFAFCVARLPIAGKPVLLALAALPLVLPSFVSAYALVLMFGRAGIVTGWLRSVGIPFESLYGAKGIVTVYALTLYPYVVLPTVAAFRSLDISVEEAAQNLGSSRLRTLRTVTLPLVLPSILAGGLLVFIEAMENFGVPFVLAEDKPILAVDHPIGRAAVIPPEKRDPVVGKGDIDVPPVCLAPYGLVPRDDPIGIADYGSAHGLLLAIRRRGMVTARSRGSAMPCST